MDFDDIGNLVADINATPERFSQGLRLIKLNAASLCPSD